MAVTESSGMTTIAKPSWLMIGFVLSLCVVALIAVLPQVAKNPPALAACQAVIAVLTVAGLARARREGLRIDEHGVTVRASFYPELSFRLA